jgi:hypothetical protein
MARQSAFDPKIGPKHYPQRISTEPKLLITFRFGEDILILASFLADLDHSMIWGSSPKMQQL